jgi:hypothetical protein
VEGFLNLSTARSAEISAVGVYNRQVTSTVHLDPGEREDIQNVQDAMDLDTRAVVVVLICIGACAAAATVCGRLSRVEDGLGKSPQGARAPNWVGGSEREREIVLDRVRRLMDSASGEVKM